MPDPAKKPPVPRSHWVRVFRISYRKHGRELVRTDKVACDTVTSGLQKAGEVWRIDTDVEVLAHVATEYFETPKTEQEKDHVDQLYMACQQRADEYIRLHYRKYNVISEDE